jgi:hypothetical protein
MALLDAFNVPAAEQSRYVHDARVEARGTSAGTQIRVTARSRCWSDGEQRAYSGNWKAVKREV